MLLHPPACHECCHACSIAATGTTELNPCGALWQGEKSIKGISRNGFEARNRQQELFLVVDAAVAGAETQ
jgi:hypothetical protein